jgi:hypothetical protein
VSHNNDNATILLNSLPSARSPFPVVCFLSSGLALVCGLTPVRKKPVSKPTAVAEAFWREVRLELSFILPGRYDFVNFPLKKMNK